MPPAKIRHPFERATVSEHNNTGGRVCKRHQQRLTTTTTFNRCVLLACALVVPAGVYTCTRSLAYVSTGGRSGARRERGGQPTKTTNGVSVGRSGAAVTLTERRRVARPTGQKVPREFRHWRRWWWY